MKQQTHIIRLTDENGSLVNFERWAHKKTQTCIEKMVELYATYPGIYKRDIDKAATITCYSTPDQGPETPVWTVTKQEFLRMVEKKVAVLQAIYEQRLAALRAAAELN